MQAKLSVMAEAKKQSSTDRMRDLIDDVQFADRAQLTTFLSPASFWWPEYLKELAWLEHARFAFWLIGELKPRVLVELGTHGGYSYFAFCQAVQAFGLDTRCYAVDHWEGDEHSGFYGEDVFAAVNQYNERRYSAFSRLVRSSFEEAVLHFGDCSIDLLHIDGRHLYEDVKRDFESWRPKLSERAIVLFHDTNVRERNFGACNFFEELCAEFPHFEFLHGHGLGIVGCGTVLPERIKSLFAASTDAALLANVRAAYASLGAPLKADFQTRQTVEELGATVRERDALVADMALKLEAQNAKACELEVKLKARILEEGELAARLKVWDAEAEELQATLEARDAAARELEAKLTVRDVDASQLEATLEARDAAARELEAKLTVRDVEASQLEAKLKAREAETTELESKLEAREAEAGALAREQKRSNEIRAKLAARKRAVQMLRRSTSWRLTAPLRAASRSLKWLLRNLRRTLILAQWLATGQVDRGAKAMRPYARRLLPTSGNALTPWDQRRKVIATAKARSRAKDWGGATTSWQAVLDKFGDNAPAAAFVQLSRAHRHRGRLDHAEEIITEGSTLHPRNSRIATEAAVVAMARKDWTGAVVHWQTALNQLGAEAPAAAYQKLHMALRYQGNNEAADAAFEEFRKRGGKTSYEEWISRNDTLREADRALIKQHIATFRQLPRFSIIMPIYNTRPEHLRHAIESVLNQLYPHWELCAVDDASPSDQIAPLLKEFAERDGRIKVSLREQNGGISACTNTALEMASGDWIILMDHDDLLAEHALYMVAEAINRNADAAIIYSDEDHIDAIGRRHGPYFKPDWNYDLFLSQNVVSHLGAYRADLARLAGGFREGFEGSQDWDFALRVFEVAPNAKVEHIPFILYHWRQTGDTFSNTSLERAVTAAERAVNEHFARTGQNAVAIPEGHSSYLRLRRGLPAPSPLVSIIIPTKDRRELLSTCIEGLEKRTDYEQIEIVIVDNGSSEADAVAYISDLRKRDHFVVLERPGPFNFSRLVNVGVAASSGEVCVLLNNDIDVISPGWLREMVSHAIRPEVGAVGAKLYYSNDTVQHGGVVLGLGGVAGHAHLYFPRSSPGSFGRLNLAQNFSCVTAACLATRRDVYDAVGGFNEDDLTVAFNDVDFCIRVREAGYQIVWTPHAELYHYESISRGSDSTPEKAARARAEEIYMRRTWGPILDNDPFYNPNLSLDAQRFSEFAETTRANKPWLELSDDVDERVQERAA